MSETISIDHLGAKGDGVGSGPGGPAYVPFTLPGETVLARRKGQRAEALSIEVPSPDRQEPPCPHFTQCGGCDLQHAGPEIYARFKRDLVGEAFRRAGLEVTVDALVPCAPAARRRAVFSAVRAGPRVLFGFHEAMSDRIVHLETCLVVTPDIRDALPTLRTIAEALIDRRGETRLTVTSTPAGLDVAVQTGLKLNAANRAAAVQRTLKSRFARLTVNGEILIEAAKPVILAGDIVVAPPPGGFLQAVADAESAMAALVVDHMQGLGPVADLFAGIGAFALRLAKTHPAHAVESEATSLAALDLARRAAIGLKPVTFERRDLFRRPVTTKELDRFAGVVFDPPRAGAEAQCRQLAGSKVKRIAAVSCNPLTLARDARILVDGGYRIIRVTPIDQFLWSHHVEAVTLFTRD